MRMKKPSYVSHLNSEVYMDLDDQVHFKSTEEKGASPSIWTNEVIPEDEEKAFPPIAEDAITDVSRRHEYYSRR